MVVLRWLAIRQVQIRISARHPMEVPPTEPAAVKIRRWASGNVMADCMNVCIVKRKISIYKESHKTTKPLTFKVSGPHREPSIYQKNVFRQFIVDFRAFSEPLYYINVLQENLLKERIT